MANYHTLDIQKLAIKMANGDVDAQNRIIDYYIKYIDKFIENNPNNLNYSKEELRNKLISILYKSINNYKINLVNNKNKIFSSYLVVRIIQFYNCEISKQKNKNEYKNREIQMLANKMINGDVDAENKIIEFYTFHITKLVEDIYPNLNYEKEDLIQIGTIGLLKAMNTYKSNQKHHFCSYANGYIKKEIERALNSSNKTLKIEYIGLTNNYNKKTFDDFIENTEVKDAIKKLSDVKKKILFLYTYGKYSLEDIGNILGFSYQRAQDHYKKSIELIKQELNLSNEKQKKL